MDNGASTRKEVDAGTTAFQEASSYPEEAEGQRSPDAPVN